MRDSEPCPLPGDIRGAKPEVPEISHELYIVHVESNNYQRYDRPSNVAWNEYCSTCWATKSNSDSSYRRVTSHYLEVSRIEIPHQCKWCNNRVARVYPASACKHCRTVYENLLRHLRKTGNEPQDLTNSVIRIESGKEAHYATPCRD